LPAFLLARGADGSDLAPDLVTQLGDAEQLLHLRLYHHGLIGLREKKAIDGAAEPVSLVTHPLDHLLLRRAWNIWSMIFLKDDSKPPY
jgi:hypothetical protein